MSCAIRILCVPSYGMAYIRLERYRLLGGKDYVSNVLLWVYLLNSVLICGMMMIIIIIVIFYCPQVYRTRRLKTKG